VTPTRAVLFDWRGTLAADLSEPEWVRLALCRVGRAHDEVAVTDVLNALDEALARQPPASTRWPRTCPRR